MKVGSLFTGVGGFDLGFELAGMKSVWFAEINAHCSTVLAHRWPDIPNLGDVRNVGRNAESVDVVCGGFPCQDLSMAGPREGLAGDKSGLWFEFHRVITELNPRWVVIENVPGLLSSNEGQDFAILLGGLTGIIPQIPDDGWGNAGVARGPAYKVAYRVLDSQFFGVAQQRRRVYIVANLGNGSAAQVLFETERSTVHPEKGSAKRRRIAKIATENATRNRFETGYVSWKKRGGFGWSQSTIITSTLESAHNYQYVAVDQKIRRVTPRENERLQGFPDDWTLTENMPDGPRYNMMGNTVTVQMTRWIGERMMKVEANRDIS